MRCVCLYCCAMRPLARKCTLSSARLVQTFTALSHATLSLVGRVARMRSALAEAQAALQHLRADVRRLAAIKAGLTSEEAELKRAIRALRLDSRRRRRSAAEAGARLQRERDEQAAAVRRLRQQLDEARQEGEALEEVRRRRGVEHCTLVGQPLICVC